MVGAFDVKVVAALGLDADQHLAKAVQGEVEASAVPERILCRFTPARFDGGANVRVQPVEKSTIVRRREVDGAADIPPIFKRGIGIGITVGIAVRITVGIAIGGPAEQQLHQRLGRGGRGWFLAEVVASTRQCLQQASGAGRGVEADAIGDAAVFVGVVGEHQRDTALGGAEGAQAGPAFSQRRHPVDAVSQRLVTDHGAFGRRGRVARRLEGNGAAQDPAVDFWQDHVHGQVTGAEALCALAPGLE